MMSKHRFVAVFVASLLAGTALMAIHAAPTFADVVQSDAAVSKPTAMQMAAACGGDQSCSGISSRSNGSSAGSRGPSLAGRSGQRNSDGGSGRSCGTGFR